MKKWFTALLFVSILAIVFVGCNGGNGTTYDGENYARNDTQGDTNDAPDETPPTGNIPTVNPMPLPPTMPQILSVPGGMPFADRADLPMLDRVVPTGPVEVYGVEFPLVYEAEDADLLGTNFSDTHGNFSGRGYVAGFHGGMDSVAFRVTIPADGFYDLNFVTATADHGFKANRIYINGEVAGLVYAESYDFADSYLRRIFLEEGEHTIRYGTYWGWMYLDKLLISPSPGLPADIFYVPPYLINPNATESAHELMRFMTDIYGRYILTGQYTDYGVNSAEFTVIRQITGQTPAVLALDLMDYTPSRVLRGATSRTIEYAIEFHEMGGIVKFCWHWGAPEGYDTGRWYRTFWVNYTDFNLQDALDGTDPDGMYFIYRDIDAISEQLKRLYEADVPVLWRPLHEAAGGWFWWGASGPQAQIDLWRLMYHRMTDYHGLNNLIWLWNGEHADWYPGDEYVDMIGEDPYPGERAYSALSERFLQALEYTDAPKMIVMSENGSLFDPDLAVRDGAMWGFFATWKREFVLASRNPPVYSEVWTEQWMLEHVYAHERTLSLEDLQERFRVN
ncbi:MAG: beta-mannosidase [Defluviitaleaceae bacterium]|nr:beta-mannosidase [Defluviitaleaceae bacterium]